MNVVFVGIFVFFVWRIFKWFSKASNHFKDRGIAAETMWNTLNLSGSGEISANCFKKFNEEKLFGMYNFGMPVTMVKDAEVIKQITVKDFESFGNHTNNFGDDGFFSHAVLNLENERWKEMRSILSPIFTSLKLKSMFTHLQACAQDVMEYFDTKSKQGRIIIHGREFFSRYTAEVISVAALGFKGNCIKDDDSKVFKIARLVSEDLGTFKVFLKMMAIQFAPRLTKLFGVQIFSKEVRDFFNTHVPDEIERRERNGINNGNDVIQLLMQAKNSNSTTKWTPEELIGQVFIFFIGGFDTTSNLLQMCSYELAKNPDIQAKLCAEVDSVVKELNGEQISFDTLNQMKYLEMVITETLRKWPSFLRTDRLCSKDYTLVDDDGSKHLFKKGDKINFPIHWIQRDPKYFPNPTRFDPERFSEENKHQIEAGSFVAFGYGPRICLGQRLAMLMSKLAIFTILSKYNFKCCEKTPEKLTVVFTFAGTLEKVFVEVEKRAGM